MGKPARDLHFEQLRQMVYEREKERHPNGCHGKWTWVLGTFKVWCQGCGYTMGINPKTMRLEHLPPIEATERCLAIVEYGKPDYEG